jgi:hypothetical protein
VEPPLHVANVRGASQETTALPVKLDIQELLVRLVIMVIMLTQVYAPPAPWFLLPVLPVRIPSLAPHAQMGKQAAPAPNAQLVLEVTIVRNVLQATI